MKAKTSAPALELWIAASPNPNFFTMIHALAWSARRYGGRSGSTSDIVVVFGREADADAIDAGMPWARQLGVRWRYTRPGVFEQFGVFGTALDRFEGPFAADVVVMLDADTLIAGNLDGLVRDTLRSEAFAGLPAHVPPWEGQDRWDELFAGVGLGAVPRTCTPSGAALYPQARGQRMPPYFNLGVLAAPCALMQSVGRGMLDELAAVNAVVDSYYRCQLAVSARICRQGVPWRRLPLRDNFPNDAAFVRHAPWEAWRWRIVHALRRGPDLDKQRDFANPQALRAWLMRRDVHGVDARIRNLLRPLLAELTA